MSEDRKAGERLLFKCVMILVGAVLAYLLLPEIWDKLSPFILAIPMAAMLQHPILFLEKKLKIKRTLSSIVLVLVTVAVGIGLLVFFLAFAIEQMSDLVNNSGDIIKGMVNGIKNLTDSILEQAVNISPDSERWVRGAMNNLIGQITDYGPELAQSTLAWMINLAASTPYMVIYISFLAMAIYFVTKDYGSIRSYLPGGSRHRQDSRSTQLSNSAVKSLVGYLRVQGIFAAIVLVGSWIYLACFGYPYAAVLSMAAGIMELIPMVGSGLLYIVLSIVYFIAGETAVGWQILALTMFLQILRRLLEPKLMSDSLSISPLQSLIGMFVGMQTGGIVGLIGGPVAMAVLVGAVRGRIFESMVKDAHTVAAYFRRRWARSE
ncbi:MAG: sporulation integral membrane protein YtvI [Oscillospiraceae bacterium]|nr:sporulation integral membrane protein YtvI [Oscillospiraceae bacterium]